MNQVVRLTGTGIARALFTAMFLLVAVRAQAATVESRYGGKLTVNPETFRLFDIPADRFEAVAGFSPAAMAPLKPLGQTKAARAGATGRVLTLLVEWENHPADQFWHPRESYDSLLYSDNVYPTGSVNDYYQEVSYGVFNVTGAVVGWLYMPTMYNGWYNIFDILNAADPLVDFSDYDGDGDGYVDALWIVHAGPGQEETHDPNDIWSHAYIGVDIPTNDGVRIDRWSVQPEEHANGQVQSIRVFCHEYGHILNLPDLYDYDQKLDTVTYFTPNDGNDHPLVDWDVMGYGGYSIMHYGNRSCPSHFCAWSRIQLGWAQAVEPPCLQGAYQLYNIEEHNTQSVFKVPINESGTEYFLLEYRNPRSAAQFDHLASDFSAYCPWFTPGRDTMDQGLLVTHIDETVPPNDGRPSFPNYAVAVVDAGMDPARPWDGSQHTEWWYPYEFRIGALFSPDDPGQTQLNAATTPSSDGYDGPSGVSIIVTAQNPDYLTVVIDKALPPVLQMVPPVTVAPEDSINVGLFATDPNCTTPGLSPNGPLPPFVALWDSGGGRGSLIIEPAPADAGVWYAKVLATDGANYDSITVQITVTPPACDCHCHADVDCDGSVGVVDVVGVINCAFRGAAPLIDAGCPPHGTTVAGRTDVNCTGATDVVDVVKISNVAFRGASAATEFCDPCQ
ncbi:MAG TPA: M6 family metalloprotease domain-containing protein [bacterium]|nr:M6 family metalloprotease domain-containing protein [bacterium]